MKPLSALILIGLALAAGVLLATIPSAVGQDIRGLELEMDSLDEVQTLNNQGLEPWKINN